MTRGSLALTFSIAAVVTCTMAPVMLQAQRRRAPDIPNTPPGLPTASEGQKAFEKSLIGHQATLLIDLYSIAVPAVDGSRRTAGLTPIARIMPDAPVSYRFTEFNTGLIDLSDSDPERLLAKVKAARSPLAAGSTFLLKYAKGTKVWIVALEWGGAIARVQLSDGLPAPVQAEPPATGLEIWWPAKFAPDFSERPAVEALLATALRVE